MFAYKVLEELGLGPKAKFIENKNIPSYLLIVTEDMPRFITFKEFKKNRGQFSELNKGIGDLIQLSNLNLRPKNDGIEEFIVNLT